MNHAAKQMHSKRAFSLVELSIVLVILGLLVGGVLSGQALIRASELRSITATFDRYQAATYTFRDKYFALPGDMTNAFAFWGTAAGCTNQDVNSAATGCNGNGDGRMNVYGEAYRVWQHLALAGLIEGSYTGTHTGNVGVIGTNVPAAKMSNAGFSVWGSNTPAGHIAWPSTTLVNFIVIGAPRVNEPPIASIINPQEAFNLDTKSDDGLPALGKTIGGAGFGTSTTFCYTGAGATAAYDLSRSAIGCAIGRVID